MNNLPPALSLRVQELRPSTRTSRPSSKEGVRKKTSKINPKPSSRHKPKRQSISFQKEVCSLGDEESFRREVAVWTAIRDIRQLRWHAPQLASSDPSTRSYVIRYPAMRYQSLDKRARTAYLPVLSLCLLRARLREYIDLMYEHGVGYKVDPNCIYLVRSESYPGWALYLGSMASADFCEPSKQTEPAWDVKKREQYDAMNCMFAFIEAHIRRKEADDAINEADATIEKAHAMIGKSCAVVGEADARMKEAEARMKEAYASVVEAYAAMKGQDSSIEEAEKLRQAGYFDRRNAEKKRSDANALEQEAKDAASLQPRDDSIMEEADCLECKADATIDSADSSTGD